MRSSFVVIILLGGCAPRQDDRSQSAIEWEEFVVVATAASDYSVGALSAIDLDSWDIQDQITPTAGDASVRSAGDWVVQLNRFNYDTVRLYLQRDWRSPSLEFSLGEQANPHDAAICADKLFISLYGRDHLGVYDLSTGHQVGQVDLSAYADGDSVGPEPAQLVTLDGQLFVALQRLDREADWSDAGGRVVQVDCAAEQATEAWAIGANTRIYPHAKASSLLVTGRGFGEEAGGLWEIEIGESATVTRLASTEADQAFVGAAAAEGGIVLVQIDHEADYSLVCYDNTSQSTQLLQSLDSFATDIRANTRGEAWVATRPHWEHPEVAGGLLVVDIDNCELLSTTPIATGLSPYALDFVEERE
jgi:hypothetical protein